MDQKDCVYTKTSKALQLKVLYLLKQHGGVTTSNPIHTYEIDMIIDYFAWNYIYGEDVGGEIGKRV